MSLEQQGLTKTENEIYTILNDGGNHRRREFFHLFCDEIEEHKKVNVLRQHMSNLRKKIRPKGLEIVMITTGVKSFYRMVRSLHPIE